MFYGLRFAPIWAIMMFSCEQVYHDWCATHHFSTFIKCVAKDCEVKMHEAWWSCVELIKPRVIELGFDI